MLDQRDAAVCTAMAAGEDATAVGQRFGITPRYTQFLARVGHRPKTRPGRKIDKLKFHADQYQTWRLEQLRDEKVAAIDVLCEQYMAAPTARARRLTAGIIYIYQAQLISIHRELKHRLLTEYPERNKMTTCESTCTQEKKYA